MNLFNLKVFQFGSSNSLLLKNNIVVNEVNKTHHLHSIIKEEVNVETTWKFKFNADNSEIKNIISTGGVNILVLLDFPLSTKPDQLVVYLLEQNKIVMVFLTPKFSLVQVL